MGTIVYDRIHNISILHIFLLRKIQKFLNKTSWVIILRGDGRPYCGTGMHYQPP